MAIEVVVGKQATIHFDGRKCVHARNCVLSHPDVFVPNVKGERIHPDAPPVDELIRIGKDHKGKSSPVFYALAMPAALALPPFGAVRTK